MQKELQEAADGGFHYRGQTVFETLLGGDEVVVILERDKDAEQLGFEYKLFATSKTGTLQRELLEAGGAGFEVVGMTVSTTALGGKLGSTHGSELSHVFGTLDRGVVAVGPPAQATPVDRQLSEVMQQYWTSFAKTGNPNSGQLPVWPRFDISSRAYVQFTDGGPIAKEALRRPFCDLYIENIRRLIAQ
jgi:hypothetical protein